MSYIEGVVLAVPAANRQEFIEHSKTADSIFIEHGATRVMECWGADVPEGKLTDFRRAVQAGEDEAVCFSWIEWPDKATRDAASAGLHEAMKNDDRFNPEKNPVPFDGKRMIYGGFDAIVEHGGKTGNGYVQGFVLPVPEGKQEAYRKMEEEYWSYFQGLGAQRLVAAWQDDVPEGKQTDFFRAVKAEPGEKTVFAFMEWPSREVCDAAAAKMMSDENMQPPADMPFDGKRMIYGGFSPVVEVEKEHAQ